MWQIKVQNIGDIEELYIIEPAVHERSRVFYGNIQQA